MKKIEYNRIVGNKYGKLTIISYLGTLGTKRHIYKCKCTCGEELNISLDALIYKHDYKNKTSCSLCDSPYKLEAEKHIGEKWGKLTIMGIERNLTKKGKHIYLYVCSCDCGSDRIVKDIYPTFRKGHTKSCGCLVKETSSINGSKNMDWKQSYKNWYLYENGQKKKCKSGMEAIFGAWLNFNSIKFKYEPEIFYLEEGRRYSPDFYLEEENCYYELKGYEPPESRQIKSREIFSKKYNLKVLKDKDLIKLCNLKQKFSHNYYYHAKKNNILKEDYIAHLFMNNYV